METRVQNLEYAHTVSVPTRGVDRVIERGLEKIVTKIETAKRRQGYTIYGKVCVACGRKVDHTHDKWDVGPKEACSCGSRRFRPIDRLDPGKVEDVINTTLRYKCRTCNRTYAIPTPCCLQNLIAPNGNELKDGWYCTGCQTIYDQPVNCCNEGRMIPGKHYEATRAEYHARPKIALPI